MSTIFDLLYREYCRARLAEMRKQLLIPVVSDKTLEADCDGGDPADPNDRGYRLGRRSHDEGSPTIG
jgi:hypothetical protein